MTTTIGLNNCEINNSITEKTNLLSLHNKQKNKRT